ncbi:hypothetical protein DNTS_000541 [Danionella cerebrum]|uniref:Peptidase M20 dimerisation domain-containing protein n=1 Tax=Danionella cerebrum TaxID=2873325 RepID=A0A553PU91_9TELE|nr:hypothetical protein DNTS_000541 [Danionella translucida]
MEENITECLVGQPCKAPRVSLDTSGDPEARQNIDVLPALTQKLGKAHQVVSILGLLSEHQRKTNEMRKRTKAGDQMKGTRSVCFLLLFTGVFSFRFQELTQYVNTHQEDFVQTLKEWIAVESDSSDVTKRPDLHRMMEMTAEKLKLIGGKVEMSDIGTQMIANGSSISLPKVVTAQFGEDPTKHTVWNLYGRGASDNKAPVLAWIHAVQVYKELNIELPVNVKLLLEGMEETGSDGLYEFIEKQKDSFLVDVDYIIISDCVWLSKRPAITYGTRGNCYFFAEDLHVQMAMKSSVLSPAELLTQFHPNSSLTLKLSIPAHKILGQSSWWIEREVQEVEGPKKDLHSGVYGGTVIEPMTDLIGILDKLISAEGQILVPGIREAVEPLSDEEWKRLQEIQFDLHTYKQEIGVTRLMYSNKARATHVEVLAHRWRYPTVSIHGIEGAFSSSGTKTVIPAKVIGKFSIRQVPNMDPPTVEKQVSDYLHSVFAKRKSPNKLNVTMVIGAKPWLADPKHMLYEAGKAAIRKVFGEDPDLIREGGTIPIAQAFQDVTGKSIIMLPIGGFDDGLHSQNEKISRYNYIEGTKLFITFLNEVSQIKKS